MASVALDVEGEIHSVLMSRRLLESGTIATDVDVGDNLVCLGSQILYYLDGALIGGN